MKLFPIKFAIERYPYKILKIIPYKSGYSGREFEKVFNMISKYNTSFWNRVELNLQEKKIIYHPKQPFCFEVFFTKEKVIFCYAIPNIFEPTFRNKLTFLLHNSDIVEIDDYLTYFSGSLRQSFTYKNSFVFSLNVDDHLNLTDNLLLLHKDIEDDQILVQYTFLPLFEYEWKQKWQSAFNKYKETGISSGGSGILEKTDRIFSLIFRQIDLAINAIMLAIAGEEPLPLETTNSSLVKELDIGTRHKSMFDGFKTNINIYLQSKDKIITQNVLRNTAVVMQDLSGDNCLKPGKLKIVKEASRNPTQGFLASTLECRQLVKLPSERYLKEYEDILDKINVAELEMPGELFKSGTILGELKRGSVYRQIHSGPDKDSNSKPLVFLSPQGGGKTTFGMNYGIECLLQGDSVVFFDTIDGKTKNTIRDYLVANFPAEKIIVLDYANPDYILPMLWNEVTDRYVVQLQKETNQIRKYRILEDFSSVISSHLKIFIDTLQFDSREQMLTPRMSKILSDITQLVFMNNGSFGMVRDCLYDAELRHKLLESLGLPSHLPFCRDVMRIDEEPESSSTLKGIESRLNLLMDNMAMKKLFSINPESKIDFSKWVNDGYCIIINVPENKFATNVNILVTFLIQKLWLAVLSSRYNIPEEHRHPCHLIIDEPNKFPQVMDILKDNIIASRKWRLRFIFLIHNMDILGRMYENLRAAGTSFFIMPTSKYNFNKVEEFFSPYSFDELKEVEKLNAKNSKARFALCSLHYKNVNYP